MDMYGNPIMYNGSTDPNYAKFPFVCSPNFFPGVTTEQSILATMPIFNQDPTNPCSNLSTYGAPIQMQPNYYGNPYGSPYGQPFSSQICQPAVSPGPYQWPPQQPNNQQTQQSQQNQPGSNQTQQSPYQYDVNLPYCSDNVPYCTDNLPYCSDSSKQQQSTPTTQHKPLKSQNSKPVRLPTIYKNFFEPPRNGDEVIAEYEEVLCHQDRRPPPRGYARPRGHSRRRQGHEVLAEYTEVLNYRPRHYSRGRRSNDDWSDYDEYDSHCDQRSCDQYYDRSPDHSSYDYSHSYDHSRSYDQCYDSYGDGRRHVRRTRSPGPNMKYYSREKPAYHNEHPANVHIDSKLNQKMQHKIYSAHKPDEHMSPQHHNAPYNDYRNARSTPQPPQRNLRNENPQLRTPKTPTFRP